MDVILDAADFVDENAGRIDASALEVMMDLGFNLGDEQRGAAFGVPGEVEMDFGIIVARHGDVSASGVVAKAETARSPMNGATGDDCARSWTRRQRRA
jgi:hypothetical protein